MSESSNSSGGESPSNSNSQKYNQSSNARSSESKVGESSYSPPSANLDKSYTPEIDKKKVMTLDEIKAFLKETEDFVVSMLPDNEANKIKFINRFRTIAVENAQELFKHPSVLFFISKFENDTELGKRLNQSVMKQCITLVYTI